MMMSEFLMKVLVHLFPAVFLIGILALAMWFDKRWHDNVHREWMNRMPDRIRRLN